MNAPSDLLTVLRASAHDLRGIPDNSVHAIITSPPFFGLRQYLGEQDVEWPTVTYRLNEWTEPITIDPWRGPLGLEPSPVAFVGHLILCLREWRRVLRKDGCIFVNLGDSFAANRSYQVPDNKHVDVGNNAPSKVPTGPKEKDLCGIPWLFAFAARADGWYLRSDIIWAKGVSFLANYAGSSMPESVTDRPSKSHEYVFLLTKSPRYYYDNEAVKETATNEGKTVSLGEKSFSRGQANGAGISPSGNGTAETYTVPAGRNLRTVWVINPQPYKKAHYAVFPERLVEPMIKAATSERGVCSACGASWKRVVERKQYSDRPNSYPVGDARDKNPSSRRTYEAQPQQSHVMSVSTTLGWQPTCTCDAGEPVPATVLDPFSGSGTTARVAIRLGRHAIACDISNEYLSDHVPGRTTVQMEML